MSGRNFPGWANWPLGKGTAKWSRSFTSHDSYDPGSNIPLSAARVTVDVAAPVRLDVSGLLLTGDGKVRSDDDFIFYNQPTGPGVTYRSGGGTAPTRSPSTPAPSRRASRRSSSPPARTRLTQSFQGIEPTATIRDADDNSVLGTFTPPQLGAETALVVVEIYLRNGVWKARAVGQGYANGLAGIATDFGVSVEERGGSGTRTGRPAHPAVQTPVAPPTPVTPPPPPAAPPLGAGKINLDKGRVSLQKNQTVSLVKGGRPLLSQVKMGLGWEPAYRGKDIDLDASVIAYGPQRNHIDSCYFGKLSILNGAIKHSGDNLTGEGGGDDEVIVVDLGRIPRRSPAWSSRSTPSPARSSPRSPRPTAASWTPRPARSWSASTSPTPRPRPAS